MPLVQDRPRETSIPETAERSLLEFELSLPDPQQGVIEEARRRQQRRRTRLQVAMVIAAVLIAVVWALIEDSQAKPAQAGAAGHTSGANPKAGRSPGFSVRIAPTMEVGRAGWQLFYEEAGEQVGGVSVGPAVRDDAYLAEDGDSSGSSSVWTTRIITAPNVAAISIEGKTRVPTVPLSGLPYGYRAARVLTPIESTQTPARPGGLRPPGPRSLLPLEADGRTVSSKPQRMTPLQAVVRSWTYPRRAPEGSCGLRASSMPGLTVQSGQVATAISPYSARAGGRQIVGHAFLPCVSVHYDLRSTPLRALILLDAAHPSARAAALPDFKPVSGSPRFFEQGGLTARREGNAWLIVAQGTGAAQRVELLRHLTALVRLRSLVRAVAVINR
jgi:hypothetical protein